MKAPIVSEGTAPKEDAPKEDAPKEDTPRVSEGTSPPWGKARDIAARALTRVFQKDAFATAALDIELISASRGTFGTWSPGGRRTLDPRDVGLATELCYGVLRVETALLTKLAKVSSGGASKFRPPSGLVRAHLLIGAFTICFLDRVPVFAAVNEAVEAVRRTADPKVSGFVNAVLRRLAESVAKNGRPDFAQTIFETCPAWLRKALGAAIGKDQVGAFLSEGRAAPPLGLCVAPGLSRVDVAREISESATVSEGGSPSAGARVTSASPQSAAREGSVTLGSVSPLALVVRGIGDLRRLPGMGVKFIAQEEGAQFVSLALGAQPGETVLDACAGHGNKTWVLAAEVKAAGNVVAADIFAPKLALVPKGLGEGKGRVSTLVIDWSKGAEGAPRNVDRALVDAPCSGTGTLRRRPEILRKRTPEDVARLALLQVEILQNVAACVRNGGRLVYAVCSVLREEAEEVVSEVIRTGGKDGARLVPRPFDAPCVVALFGEVTSFRLLPHVHGTDGYFAASFEVVRP